MLHRKSKGFSLAELLIWITIVGILSVFMVPRIGKLFKMVSNFKANSVLRNWDSKIKEYYLDMSNYPETLKDLWTRPSGKKGDNWRGPYTEDDETGETPLDHAGNELIYNRPPVIFKDKYKHYELISTGGEDSVESGNVDKFISVGG